MFKELKGIIRLKRADNLVFVIFIIFIFLISCSNNKDRFKQISSKKSKVDFNNEIFEDDSFNIIEYGHIYNGGGVAIADFNNDDLQDLYFTGNMVSNKLYLNQGDFEFKDVTEASNSDGENKWCYGVAVVDINNDGFKDIYIAVTANPDSLKTENILYVHQGLDRDGVPRFENKAKEYGLDDNSHTTNAVFFDYDNDGDLDVYLLINKVEFKRNSRMDNNKDMKRMSRERMDKLLENNWDKDLGHPVFHDVSDSAGIMHDGFGLGVNVSDINQDGYKDIYVTNDYSTQDLTYINQGDGTFKDLNSEYFKHISFSAMGNDIVDYNNDGFPDIFVLDMLPEDNFRKKTMVPANNYSSYLNRQKNGYQFVRNTLQLNQGTNPETGDIIFSEIGIYSGIAATDWSWAPLVADFDNDGFRDLIVTNGFPKDVTDRDYVEFQTEYGQYAPAKMLIEQIPSVKIMNYAFQNAGNGKFEDVSEKWGIRMPSFSNGAAYGDLDNDGDLDYVVNNINDKAFIYQNLTTEKHDPTNNWLKISLIGNEQNINAIGTIMKLYTKDTVRYWEHTISRGYLSCMDDNIHFGLGKNQMVDSLIVFWPNGKKQKLNNLKSNQRLILNIVDADIDGSIQQEIYPKPLFENVSSEFEDVYKYRERDFNDYNVQPMIPHKLTQYGPGISVGDVDNDGLEDLYLGGANFFKGRFLVQKENGEFENKDLLPGDEGEFKEEEELGSLLFDADQDGDLDLYLVSGSYEFTLEDGDYQDKLYLNTDDGFKLAKNALPKMIVSGSCVKAADFDKDGDLDLFVGGRVYPHQYPRPVDSYVLINQSTKDQLKFEMANPSVNSQFKELGMVTDALWTDFNNDSWIDLIVVGEWMPVKFYQNENGKLVDVSSSTDVSDKVGWWNSLASIDIDHDGDMDYIAGNLGLNSLFQASEDFPLMMYSADFDHNGEYDAIPVSYFKNDKGEYAEYPFYTRVDYQKQIPGITEQYPRHAEFGFATTNEIFSEGQLDSAYILVANYMASSIIENLGNNRFEIRPLPDPCQWSPVYGIATDDFNHDGHEDIMMVGNDFGAELLNGKYDASNGLVLLGDGKGMFNPLSVQESGIYISGDAKALVRVKVGEEMLYVATQNRSHLKVYRSSQSKKAGRIISLQPNDFKVSVVLKNGLQIVKEYPYGNTFISQSSRKIIVPTNYEKIEITSFNGKKRPAE